MTPAGRSVRPWLPVSALLLAVAGLVVSAYLTIAHFSSPEFLICAEGGVVDCHSVTTSPESEFFGIPVAVLGVLYFVFMAAVDVPAAWRSTNPVLGWLRLGGAAVGVLFVVYLVAAELVLIGKICLWCTVVHVVTLALAGLILAGALAATGGQQRDQLDAQD
ncbi:vitamin K epoxide reductase family protein [Goodfellowiella coeruleoviolacea]|uniref:Membrane protein n=1 Tax=Goodfellowiella coeruleoviolacea TaxID=334858 RepID=A0AAE3GPT9_9PSEU|nr:vitamin K epoxide reductase family protein [Goodfellowiella coeruleoviolacea]MCP2169963.1 putative membrane protein [Goodfellowiella coeruleoviolacea]